MRLFIGLLSCTAVLSLKKLGADATASQAYLQPRPLKVAIISGRLSSWNDYQYSTGYKGGEAYWYAGIHLALQRMNVTIDFLPDSCKPPKSGNDLGCNLEDSDYHRFLLDGRKSVTQLLQSSEHVWSRIRVLDYFGSLIGSEAFISPLEAISSNGTHTGMWKNNRTVPILVHGPVVHLTSPSLERGRRLFLLGHDCHFLRGASSLIKVLATANFDLHVTMDPEDCEERSIVVPDYVTNHGLLSPPAFSQMLRSMAAVIGLAAPLASPTPLEGLAAGAAFLNPCNESDIVSLPCQFPQLAHLGAPYVYNYNMDDTSTLITAAEMAITRRFVSYVNKANQLDNVEAAVCGLILSGTWTKRGCTGIVADKRAMSNIAEDLQKVELIKDADTRQEASTAGSRSARDSKKQNRDKNKVKTMPKDQVGAKAGSHFGKHHHGRHGRGVITKEDLLITGTGSVLEEREQHASQYGSHDSPHHKSYQSSPEAALQKKLYQTYKGGPQLMRSEH